MKSASILVASLLFFASAGARADATAEARAHYRKATSHFAVGEFDDAAREYQAAYKLKPDAALLYNAAQSCRLAGNNKQALILYRNYANFYPRGQSIVGVREQMARLEETVRSEEKAKSAPPQSTEEPQVTFGPEPSPAPETKIVAGVQQQEPLRLAEQPKKQPVYKKWWLWTIVVVVVAGGVAAGVVLGTEKPASWSTGSDIGPGSHSALKVSW